MACRERNVGIQGSQAGSALRRLAAVSAADAQRLQKIFGVAFTDAAGNALPLVEVMADVNRATKDLSSGERAKKFKDAFGLLGITAASAIGKAAESIGDLKGKLDNAGGVAAKTAEEMEAGLGGSFRKLISAAEGIAIAVGEALSGPLGKLAKVLTIISGAVTEFASGNKKLLQTVAGLALALTGVGGVLLFVGASAGFLAFVFSGLATAVGFAAGLVSLLGAMVSPIALVTAALAAAGVAFVKFTDTGKGYDPGELLFSQFSGRQRGNGDWSITFGFKISENQTNLTYGSITGVNKLGWQYLWVQYKDEEDAVAKALVPAPIGVYVADVYRTTAFSALGV